MYTPADGEEGIAIIKAALRAYILADLSSDGLPSVIQLLPNGAGSIIDQGFFTEQTPCPVIMFSDLGDGQSDAVKVNSLVRLILYVVDRGRGLSQIEQVLSRLRKRLNRTHLAVEYFTLPPTSELVVESIEATGSTAVAALPAWGAQAQGLYLFIYVRGLQSDYWSG